MRFTRSHSLNVACCPGHNRTNRCRQTSLCPLFHQPDLLHHIIMCHRLLQIRPYRIDARRRRTASSRLRTGLNSTILPPRRTIHHPDSQLRQCLCDSCFYSHRNRTRQRTYGIRIRSREGDESPRYDGRSQPCEP